jgi:hypothetical protein
VLPKKKKKGWISYFNVVPKALIDQWIQKGDNWMIVLKGEWKMFTDKWQRTGYGCKSSWYIPPNSAEHSSPPEPCYRETPHVLYMEGWRVDIDGTTHLAVNGKVANLWFISLKIKLDAFHLQVVVPVKLLHLMAKNTFNNFAVISSSNLLNCINSERREPISYWSLWSRLS